MNNKNTGDLVLQNVSLAKFPITKETSEHQMRCIYIIIHQRPKFSS